MNLEQDLSDDENVDLTPFQEEEQLKQIRQQDLRVSGSLQRRDESNLNVRINPVGWIVFTISVFLLSFGFAINVIYFSVLGGATLSLFFAYFLHVYIISLWDLDIELSISNLSVRAKDFLSINALIFNNLEKGSVSMNVKLDTSEDVFFIDNPITQWITIPPKEEKELSWTLLFPMRGISEVGTVKISTGRNYGLFTTEIEYPQTFLIEVLPEVPRVIVSREFKKRLFSHLMGLYSQRVKGMGTEFLMLKEYVRGDEVRFIDWKASARHRELFVREFEAEQNLQAIVAVDCGKTMQGQKLEFALASAFEIAELFILGGQSVGIILYSNQVDLFIKPDGGRKQVRRIMDILSRSKAKNEPSDLNVAVDFIRDRKWYRSLIFIISDLDNQMYSTESNSWGVAFQKLAQGRHQVALCELRTPGFGVTSEFAVERTRVVDLEHEKLITDVIFAEIYRSYDGLEKLWRIQVEKHGNIYIKVNSMNTNILIEIAQAVKAFSSYGAERADSIKLLALNE
ncbi:MAG: DUF58 domain-containing protein [Candidatus Kariarchaeaceae archaeon]